MLLCEGSESMGLPLFLPYNTMGLLDPTTALMNLTRPFSKVFRAVKAIPPPLRILHYYTSTYGTRPYPLNSLGWLCPVSKHQGHRYDMTPSFSDV